MNEYDLFQDRELENDAPESEELPAGDVPELETPDFEAPAGAELEAPIGAELEESCKYDHVGPSDDDVPDFEAPAGAEFEESRKYDHVGPQDDDSIPFDPEAASDPQPGYHSYYYASGPVRNDSPERFSSSFTVRPAQGYTASAQTRAAQTQPVRAETKQEKRRSGGFWKKAIALALVCALLGGAAGFGGALLATRNRSQSASPVSANSANSGTAVQVAAPRETTELNVVTVDSGKLMTASQVYKANVNSTVGITTEITTTNWWGYQSTSAAAGSGFILTEDGYILTNKHVIENANTITVAMYDGTKYAATLVGYDASNDIAVLKIDAEGLTPVTLGDSDALEVGDEVIAIGNPLGELTFSLTKGNVSALGRAVTLSSSVTMKLIQTDAAINSGNSGGALFNMYGEVVGITNAKYSSSGYSGEASIDNIGFAIPINSVREIVTSIIEKGCISTPYIGVTVGNVSEESQSYGMPQGAALRSVEQGGPAEQAGLQANDIVTAINGETITGFEDLKERIKASQPGDRLDFTVYRQGETVTITVTVGEKTQSALPNQSSQQQSGQSGQGQNGWGGSGQQDGQGQNGYPGQDGQSGQGQNPWGGSGSGNNGSEGSGSDPFSWFFGGGYGN